MQVRFLPRGYVLVFYLLALFGIISVMDPSFNPEFKKILEKNLKLSEENNKILKKIHGSIKWGRVFKLLYWLFIIGTAVGAYYFLQPFIESAQGTLDSLTGGLEGIQNIGQQIPDLGSILEGLQQ